MSLDTFWPGACDVFTLRCEERWATVCKDADDFERAGLVATAKIIRDPDYAIEFVVWWHGAGANA